jgi:hypothetical protein
MRQVIRQYIIKDYGLSAGARLVNAGHLDGTPCGKTGGKMRIQGLKNDGNPLPPVISLWKTP